MKMALSKRFKREPVQFGEIDESFGQKMINLRISKLFSG